MSGLPPGARIVADAHGIPHIWAESERDVAFAQGWEAAHSRTWQLESDLRHATGTVAAVLGANAVEWDAFARRCDLVSVAIQAFSALDSESQDFFESYAAGVSAALASGVTCVELTERHATPHPWQEWSPIAVFLVNQLLFGTFPDKLWLRAARAAVARADAPGGLVDLLLTDPAGAAGSNAFVLSGERTTTGKPLIAGDPHRLFTAPNVYAQVHLACPSWDVVGFTFPGVPGVQHFGHTESVAWAITNAMADYQDLWIEDEHTIADDDIRALIEVADGENVAITCYRGAHGPVIIDANDRSDGHVPGADGDVAGAGAGAGERLSLSSPSLCGSGSGLGAVLPLLRARTVTDVERAFEAWVEPVNSLVTADTTGAVSHRVVGVVPRPNPAPTDLLRVMAHVPRAITRNKSAQDPAADPVGQLPRLAPRDGAIVSANQHLGNGFDAISSRWAPSFRADRIHELLAAKPQWDAQSVGAILADTWQSSGSRLLDLVVALANDPPDPDPTTPDPTDSVRALAQELNSWDRQMSADSVTAARFAAIRRGVVQRLGAHPAYAAIPRSAAEGALFDPWFALEGRIDRALHHFVDPAADAVLREAGIDIAQLVWASVCDEAATPTTTPWGQLHRFFPVTVEAMYAVPGRVSPASGTALPGDNDCVNAAGWWASAGLSVRGPVARYVWDLADRERSAWVVPLGSSGTPDDPHETDQTGEWVRGRLIAVGADRARHSHDQAMRPHDQVTHIEEDHDGI